MIYIYILLIYNNKQQLNIIKSDWNFSHVLQEMTTYFINNNIYHMEKTYDLHTFLLIIKTSIYTYHCFSNTDFTSHNFQISYLLK